MSGRVEISSRHLNSPSGRISLPQNTNSTTRALGYIQRVYTFADNNRPDRDLRSLMRCFYRFASHLSLLCRFLYLPCSNDSFSLSSHRPDVKFPSDYSFAFTKLQISINTHEHYFAHTISFLSRCQSQ